MKKVFNKIALLTSGGDAPGMNAVIRSVVRTCVFHKIVPIGIYKGYDGLIKGKMSEMNARSVKGIINKGGTILKTARSKDFSCLLYTSPSPRDRTRSRMPSSA